MNTEADDTLQIDDQAREKISRVLEVNTDVMTQMIIEFNSLRQAVVDGIEASAASTDPQDSSAGSAAQCTDQPEAALDDPDTAGGVSSDQDLAESLTAQIGELQTQLDEALEVSFAVADENTLLNSTNSELSAGNNELTDSNAALKSANAELAATNTELADANSQLSKANSELTKTNASLKGKNAQPTDAENELTETNAELTETNAGLTETNAGLTETNAGLTETNAGLTETNAELTESNAELTETNAELTETNAELTETNAELTETNAELTETNAELTETNAELTETNAGLTITNAELTAALEDLRLQVDDLAKLNESFSAGVSLDTQQLDELRDENAALIKQNEELASRIAAATVEKTVSSSNSGDNLSWEERKALIMDQLSDDTFDADAFIENLGDQTGGDVIDPIQYVQEMEAELQRRQDELDRRDEEIKELQILLQNQAETRDDGVVYGAAAIAEMVDSDELVRAEQDRLQKMQAEWEEKFRATEIAASLERAKLSRERQEMARTNSDLEDQLADLKRELKSPTDPSKPPQRRWLAKLGLDDKDGE